MTTATQKIPSGYKQTDVGVIPADWTVTTLLQISPSGISNGVFNDPAKVGKGYRLINVLDLYKGYSIDTKNLSRLELPVADFVKNKVKKGDIFFTRSSITPEGIAYCNFCDEDAGDITFDGHVMKVTPNPKIANSAFLRLYCISKVARKYLVSSAKQTTMTTIGQSDIAQLPVILPSLAEQFDIATSVSDAHALVEKIEKLIVKKKNIKQGAMQELLTGKRRLAGFSGKWETKKLGEVVEIKKGQLITDSTRIDGHIPVIAGGKTPAYFHNKANRLGKTITISGSGANAGYVAFYTSPIFVSDCSTIEESKSYSIEFIYFLLQLMQEKIYKMQTGGAQPHIHPNDLIPIEVSVPKVDEQNAIATVLSDMDTEIEKLESQLTKYQNLKQGMMQVLLTGKIRLLSK